MYLAYREEFDSPTMNELRSADCHSYVDDCSTAKAPHLERLPLWKTHDTNKGLWINAPPAPDNGGRQQHLPRYSLVTDEVLHPIGKVQPLLIGLNVPDQVDPCTKHFPSQAHPRISCSFIAPHAPGPQPSPRPGHPSRGPSEPRHQEHRWMDQRAEPLTGPQPTHPTRPRH